MSRANAAARDLPKALQLAGGVTVRSASKDSLRLADKMQDALIAEGWPVGKNLGPEAAIARHHGTTDRVVREALRVLEWRGLGNVRRGHAGGLVVSQPSLDDAGRFLGLYLAAIGCSAAEVARHGEGLLQQLPPDAWRARDFVASLVERIEHSMRYTSESGDVRSPNRALQIAFRILRDLDQPGALLTLDGMMDRYHVGRPVLVQALRALESVELIHIARGRAGGVTAARPSPGAVVRAVLPAFAASGLPLLEFGAILMATNEKCAIEACRSPARLSVLQKMADDLDEQAFARGNMAAQVRILRKIASYSGDELSHVLGRSVWYYLSRQGTPPATFDLHFGRSMVEATRKIVDGVLAGNPQATIKAGRELHRRLGEAIMRSAMAEPDSIQ